MKTGMAALAAILLATPAYAAADNPFSADSAVLDLHGLNLSTVDGQQRLAIRMDQVADVVCGAGLSSVHLALGAQGLACKADVIADIRTRISAATALGAAPVTVRLAIR